MILLAVVLVLLALGVTVVVVELRRAPPRATTWSRGRRVGVMGALGALMLVAVSPSIFLIEHRDLPTERPPEPWRRPAEGCGDGDSHTLLLVMIVGIYVVVRGGPAAGGMIAAAAGKPGRPRREPDGRFALRVATVGFAIVGGLVTLRVAACGAPPDRFTTYGALTPAGAGGWRVDAALALALDGRRAIPEGTVIAEELERHGGSHGGLSSGPFTTARAGLQAWVGDAPVLFHLEADTGRVVGSPVAHRDPSMIPHERRPHYAAWPEVARLDRQHLVIVGPAGDGGTLAVKVGDYDVRAVPATYADAGLLVRPPLFPWLLGLALAAFGLALAHRARRRDDAGARMLGAWFIFESIAIMLYGSLGAFGITPL